MGLEPGRRRRGVSSQKPKNLGCVFCGGPHERTLWLLGAGRVPCCQACATKKIAEGRTP